MAKAKQPLIKALVEAIEKYPAVWDKNDPDFKINYQKQVAWTKIHAEMKNKVQRYSLFRVQLNSEKVSRFKTLEKSV